MYPRIFKPSQKQSYFIFGARGTGKSSWLNLNFKQVNFVNLLEDETFNLLNASPGRLSSFIQDPKKPVIIDELQKIPHLLDEVHRLIESQKLKFILTGSSARKLRRQGVNLLAGRALTYHMHPLTCVELGRDFDLKKQLKFGCLPMAVTSFEPKKFLQSYVRTYIKEEVQLEGLTRNIAAFSRFLEAASFSQAAPLNVTKVAAECSVERKVVEDYFSILRDLLLSFELPIFSKKAKRELIAKSKFYFFDSGVFNAIRKRGPLDSDAEINGFAFETLVVQNIRALNDYCDWDYELFYWHTRKHEEIDLVLYGPRGLIAIEIKSSARIRPDDVKGLKIFGEDYPMAKKLLIYGGNERKTIDGIEMIPAEIFFKEIESFF